VLSRDLAVRGHYPAIDVLQSISRLAPRLADAETRQAAQRLREAMAAYQASEDLIRLGAYVSGANPPLDAAIALQDDLRQFLRQPAGETTALAETRRRAAELAARLAGGTA
jgi:flagellar biosynthesis/type III secretory pathway ATPase